MKIDIVLSDLHIPYYDRRLLDQIIRYLSSLKIDTIYLDGDIIDFISLSRFRNEPIVVSKLQENIDHLKWFFSVLISKLNVKQIIYVKGNHEHRLHSYVLDNCPSLYSLNCLTYEGLFETDKYGIKFIDSIDKDAYIVTPYNVAIGHFDKARKHSGWTCKQLVNDYGISIIQAHTHKMGSYLVKTLDGKLLEGYECGCLCDPTQSYMSLPNWQQGFIVIEYDNSGNFLVRQKLIKEIEKKNKRDYIFCK